MKALIAALALTLSAGTAAVAAEPQAPLGPLDLVKSSVTRVVGIVQSSEAGSEERRVGIAAVRRELFDVTEIARRTLGTHWRSLAVAERQEFVRLFGGVLDRAFIASVDGYSNESVTFVGETIDGTSAHVRSKVTPGKGAAVSIDYRLHAVDARWMVYDVVLEHVSLVGSYRSQFNSVIRTSSFAELLERMRIERQPRRESDGPSPVALSLMVLTRGWSR